MAQNLSIVTAGFAGGQAKRGVELGPEAVLKSGMGERISKQLGLSIRVREAIHDQQAAQAFTVSKPENDMNNAHNVSAATRDIAQKVYESAKEGGVVLTLGGDHSIAIGSLVGSQKAVRERLGPGKKLGVVYLDAHADINTPATSPSKNIHGMALAFASGLAKAEEFSWIEEQDWINLSKLVYIGLRDVDDAEWDVIKEHKILAFSMADIKRDGIVKVMDAAMQHIGEDAPIHISFDIDGLDPGVAPSTGFPVEGGVSLEDGCYMAERIGKSGNLVSLDLVEINPDISAEGAAKTIEAGIKLVEAALGAAQGS